MNRKSWREVYTPPFLAGIFALAAVDIVTKVLATLNLEKHRPVEILGDFLRFTLVGNTGGIFGLFPNNLIPSTIIMLIAIGTLVYMYWRENDALGSRIGWMFVMGGALGNFIDKLFRKVSFEPNFPESAPGWELGLTPLGKAWVGVVDFFDMPAPGFFCQIMQGKPDCRWYIFNVADIYISIGVGLILLSMLRAHHKEKNSNPENGAGPQP